MIVLKEYRYYEPVFDSCQAWIKQQDAPAPEKSRGVKSQRIDSDPGITADTMTFVISVVGKVLSWPDTSASHLL